LLPLSSKVDEKDEQRYKLLSLILYSFIFFFLTPNSITLGSREDEFVNTSNYWCVKLIKVLDDKRPSGLNRCTGCGIPGRPLYCSISSHEPKWHLVGIEMQSDVSEIRHRQLFENRNTFRFIKISKGFHWILKTINDFQ